MPLFTRNQVLAAKIETEPGTDIVPAGADAIKCAPVDVTVDGKSLEDPSVRSSISAQPRRFVNKIVRFTISVVLKGSGDADTPPEISPLLQSCAMEETVNAETSVVYNPVNAAADMKTCSIYVWKDGLCIKAAGCMGNIRAMFQAGEYAMITFEMEGKFVNAVDAVNPTPTYDTTTAIEVKNGGLSFGSWDDAVARNFEFNTGNTLVARGNVNASDGLEAYIVTARDPNWGANIEAVLEATNTFWADYIARDTVALDFTHGTVAGNIVEFAAPKANFDAPRFGEIGRAHV